jgi:hypothetical protein
MIVKFIDYLRNRQKTLIRLCYGVLAALVILDIFADKSKAHTWLETIPGFWALFGFAACVLIIILSKWFGHLGIMTREDYYDN